MRQTGFGRFLRQQFLWLSQPLLLRLAALAQKNRRRLRGSGDVSVLGSGDQTLRIVSGSENKELEPILEEYADEEDIRIEMSYKGSLDIMRLLEEEDISYDAVWPASSLWLTVGDIDHRIKHAESISITPVVFGIRRGLAEELGLCGPGGFRPGHPFCY